MGRLAAYARQSKYDTERVPSTTWQHDEMTKWAERNGHTIVRRFSDVDRSGFQKNVKREDFKRLLAAMGEPDVDGAIVWKLNRLSRQGQWGKDTLRFMEAKGDKELIAVVEHIDTSTAMGEAMLGLVLSQAKGESEAISQQWRRIKRAEAEAGRPRTGGHRWFGWTADFKVDRTEARLIRHAAQGVLDGLSLRSVALDWQRREVRTSAGGTWSTKSLRQMLRSYRLAGFREYQGELIPATWPAILERDTVDRLRRLLDDPSRRPGAPTSSLLGGILYCKLCGGKLTAGKTTTGSRRYKCKTPPEGCGRMVIAGDATDRDIGARLVAHLIRLNLKPEAPDLAPVTDAIEAVKARLAVLAEDYYVAEKIDELQFHAASKALQAKLGRLDAEAAVLERRTVAGDLAGDPATLSQRWWSLTVEQQRAIIGQYVERITVHPALKGRNRFDPDRITVKWS